jgi:hypothetical protein
MKTLASLAIFLFAAPGLTAQKPTKADAIQWLHASDDGVPESTANDPRPTILYFTFDT